VSGLRSKTGPIWHQTDPVQQITLFKIPGAKQFAAASNAGIVISTLSKKPTFTLTHSSARFSTLRQHMPI
jgi:hypothetical protein